MKQAEQKFDFNPAHYKSPQEFKRAVADTFVDKFAKLRALKLKKAESKVERLEKTAGEKVAVHPVANKHARNLGQALKKLIKIREARDEAVHDIEEEKEDAEESLVQALKWQHKALRDLRTGENSPRVVAAMQHLAHVGLHEARVQNKVVEDEMRKVLAFRAQIHKLLAEVEEEQKQAIPAFQNLS